MSESRNVARALDALRHGWAIRVTGAGGALDLLPAETAFVQPGIYAARLLISAARAATLKLANQRDAAVPEAPVMIHGAEPFSLSSARNLADPAQDLGSPLRGPFKADPIEADDAAVAAMDMARLAGILPAFLVSTGVEIAADVSTADLAAFK
ncbi:MAG: hypothetical protein VW962_00200, partial [Acidimicrobiaceae bacterium]